MPNFFFERPVPIRRNLFVPEIEDGMTIECHMAAKNLPWKRPVLSYRHEDSGTVISSVMGTFLARKTSHEKAQEFRVTSQLRAFVVYTAANAFLGNLIIRDLLLTKTHLIPSSLLSDAGILLSYRMNSRGVRRPWSLLVQTAVALHMMPRESSRSFQNDEE
jgi:hypothetical protein